MGQDEKLKEAQEILDWAIIHLNGNMKCKVIDCKHKSYRVQFFTKENKLIMPVQILEEWIKGTNPRENLIHDNLNTLLRNLENH
ncbi:MAG: hypothetical protein ACE144_07555 [Thermodesulfobacteriota bacterium]